MGLDFLEDFDEPDRNNQSVNISIVKPSGAQLILQNQSEANFYNQLKDQITEIYEFTDPSDLIDLDRILDDELLIYRLTNQMNSQTDFHGQPLTAMDIQRLAKSRHDASTRLGKQRDSLGLTRTARNDNEGESIAKYIKDLLHRAGEEGIHRNEQVNEALALINEIYSVCSTHLRCNDTEREKLGYEDAEAILRWICEDIFPKYQEVDKKWKKNQKTWVTKL